METVKPNDRNYTSISPSAKVLLLMKGYTNIPFARQAAEIMTSPEKFSPDYDKEPFTFCIRVAHFEMRYQSIDQLLSELAVKNIIELSSGFSFRSVAAVEQQDVHYIDTDLAEVIEKKRELIGELQVGLPEPKGKLEVLPLNALDEESFNEAVNRFSEGPVAIINEGLLMYLGWDEKKQLCSIIHKILVQRGGYWITADIYIKTPPAPDAFKMNDDFQKFLDEHQIDDNKFDSFEAAELFFNECGFEIDKEAEPDYSKTSVLPYIIKKMPTQFQQSTTKPVKFHTTWRLKISGDLGKE